ncbi:hypothetical protein AVEN_194593-1 [Araneus ventricosus]|uniref:Uncharacterized protein n=1 Tax=Araneus ventricosus TaxID=182803 RepID=A0A4Y2A6B4_ARAVE|nr:hypothetical protein AVEN_194593-1 [Araneus ventricosus]
MSNDSCKSDVILSPKETAEAIDFYFFMEASFYKVKEKNEGRALYYVKKKATCGLFWDGPPNFEPWSDDEDDTWAGTSSPNFHSTPTGERLATTYDLACSRPLHAADPQWNRVSNLEPSGPKAETLPLDHRSLK